MSTRPSSALSEIPSNFCSKTGLSIDFLDRLAFQLRYPGALGSGGRIRPGELRRRDSFRRRNDCFAREVYRRVRRVGFTPCIVLWAFSSNHAGTGVGLNTGARRDAVAISPRADASRTGSVCFLVVVFFSEESRRSNGSDQGEKGSRVVPATFVPSGYPGGPGDPSLPRRYGSERTKKGVETPHFLDVT
jgi:hypothetical protein